MPSKRSSNVGAKGRQGRQANNARHASSLQPARSAVSNDLFGVALIALSAAMAVALLVSTPAPVTQQAREILRQCFGAGALLFPCGLALFGLTFFADQYGLFPAHIAAGLGLIVVAVLSLMSLSWPGAEQQPHLVLEQEVLLARGGYVGGGVAWALLSSVGFAVGTVVLIALIVVGCIICGFSISGFVMRVRNRAAVAGAELQASRERRFEERQQRKREQQAARAERQIARDMTFGPQNDGDRSYDHPTSGEVSATSFLGSRKTTVLRRGTDATVRRPMVSQSEVSSSNDPDAAPTRRIERTKDASSPTPSPQEDTGTTLLSIPSFLRRQARQRPSESPHTVEHSTPPASDEPPFDQATGHTQEASMHKKAPSSSSRKASARSDRGVPARSSRKRPGDGEEGFTLPPFEVLSSNPHSGESASSDAELTSTMRRLQATLAQFGLRSQVVDYVSGPLVTTFQIEMGEGERVNKIVNLEDDIALTLAAESVRIFAPIPGTSRVGIEIPNKKRENVCLGDVLPYAKGGPLEFAVGRDASGKAVIADLAKMPHLLVAGATGSGKSVMINALIMSILMRDTPKQVRLILVDPKRVEFSGYNGLPHLYVPVVTEPRQAASALQWAVSEMERRLKVFERAGARNIGVYNEMCVSGKLAEMDNPPEPMPFLVIIIDELSDLMMVAGKDVEASIVRIAQLARAAGIHLVLATQRPSADVVTGLIKSNIETRIALSVASSMDSRVILDQTGADRLLGNGDMLFKYRGHRTRRILGCYVSDDEIESVVDHWRDQGEPDYHEEILTQVTPSAPGSSGSTSSDADEDDPLVWEAAQIVVESQLGSTSGLQRRLKVGYARAGRIMDMLEAKGIVGPPDGSKPREVLLDEDGLEELRAAEEKYREV